MKKKVKPTGELAALLEKRMAVRRKRILAFTEVVPPSERGPKRLKRRGKKLVQQRGVAARWFDQVSNRMPFFFQRGQR